MSSTLGSELNPIFFSSPPAQPGPSFSDDLIDPCLRSSPLPTSPLPESQQTVLSPHLEILSSKNGPRSRKCVKYPDKKNFGIESEFLQKKDDFLQWWRTTPSAAQFEKKGKTMQWGGSKYSAGWQHFIEVACIDDGTPQVYCIHCTLLVNHPAACRNGTKTIKLHPQSQKCGYQDPVVHRNTSMKDYVLRRSVSFYSYHNNSLLILFICLNRQIHQMCLTPAKHFRNRLFILLLATGSLSD